MRVSSTLLKVVQKVLDATAPSRAEDLRPDKTHVEVTRKILRRLEGIGWLTSSMGSGGPPTHPALRLYATTPAGTVEMIQLLDQHSAGDRTRIPIHGGERGVVAFASIDADNYDRLNEYSWSAHDLSAPNGFYAARSERSGAGNRKIYMHRVVWGLQRGDKRELDHIDRNKLNNRRDNLRIATRAQNMQNLADRGGSSQYRGVCWSIREQCWKAYAGLDGITQWVGKFTTEEEAHEAIVEWRRVHMPYSAEASLLDA